MSRPLTKSIWDYVDTSSTFSTFKQLAVAAGFDEVLKKNEPMTAFIPTNQAFLFYEDTQLISQPENANWLKETLSYHVLPKHYNSKDLKEGKYKTLNGKEFKLDVSTIKSIDFTSKIVEGNLQATNGVVHIIDQVLVPYKFVDVLARHPQFSDLVSALKATDLWEKLSGTEAYTLFAPTNTAFKRIGKRLEELMKPENKDKLTNLLGYHILKGAYKNENIVGGYYKTLAGNNVHLGNKSQLVLNGYSKLVYADTTGTNGLFHEIDSVLLPQNVLESAAANPNLSLFIQAVEAAGMADALSGLNYQFTVYAPNNEAFSHWASFNDYLKPENAEKLREILQYHILPKQQVERDFVDGEPVQTLLPNRTISVVLLKQYILNGYSRVIQTDLVGLNGAVHIINEVLFPETLEDALSNDSELSQFYTMVKAAGFEETLKNRVHSHTIYVPALSKLGTDAVNDLLNPDNKEKLVEFVTQHIFAGVDTTWKLLNEKPTSFRALNTKSVKFGFSENGNDITMNENCKLIKRDRVCANGVIHVLDNAIINPPQ